jgi:NADH-quinone oxidoreductase subunit E
MNVEEQVNSILSDDGGDRGELIPILQEVQHQLGYLPEEAMQRIAKFVRLSSNQVFGVATFYAQFKFTPTGRHLVHVCRGTACHVKGGPRILEAVERELGVKPGETTPNREYTLETVACIGCCGLAPTMVIDKDTYGNMTSKKVEEVFRKGKGES